MGSKSYKVSRGNIRVEAPTKNECLELFNAIVKVKVERPIDEAIR